MFKKKPRPTRIVSIALITAALSLVGIGAANALTPEPESPWSSKPIQGQNVPEGSTYGDVAIHYVPRLIGGECIRETWLIPDHYEESVGAYLNDAGWDVEPDGVSQGYPHECENERLASDPHAPYWAKTNVWATEADYLA